MTKKPTEKLKGAREKYKEKNGKKENNLAMTKNKTNKENKKEKNEKKYEKKNKISKMYLCH